MGHRVEYPEDAAAEELRRIRRLITGVIVVVLLVLGGFLAVHWYDQAQAHADRCAEASINLPQGAHLRGCP